MEHARALGFFGWWERCVLGLNFSNRYTCVCLCVCAFTWVFESLMKIITDDWLAIWIKIYLLFNVFVVNKTFIGTITGTRTLIQPKAHATLCLAQLIKPEIYGNAYTLV